MLHARFTSLRPARTCRYPLIGRASVHGTGSHTRFVQESPTKLGSNHFCAAAVLLPPAGLLLLMQSRDSALQKLDRM